MVHHPWVLGSRIRRYTKKFAFFNNDTAISSIIKLSLANVFVFTGLNTPAQVPKRLSPPDVMVQRKLALVIGNSNYAKSPLTNPKNDAREITSQLRRLDFQATSWTDLDRKNMNQRIAEFIKVLRPGDLALFYYSGHGVQYDQENYLIPVDYQADSSAADLPYDAIPAAQVRDRLEKSGARIRVLILDACRDNPFLGTKSETHGLAPMGSAAEGTLIAYATADNHTADDNPSGSNGLYTKFLLQALDEKGLTLKQIFEYTRYNVWDKSGHRQRPYTYDSLIGDIVLTLPDMKATQNHADSVLSTSVDHNARSRSESSPVPPKNYKDRAEYDLFARITQTADLVARLQLLNQWQNNYPQTDYANERLQYYLATLSGLTDKDPGQRQLLIQKAGDLLKMDPKNFRALYLITLHGPILGGQNPPRNLVVQVNSAAQGVISVLDEVFDPSKKPANVSQADFQKIKYKALAVAHNALAWEAVTKNDNTTAESEYKSSLQADPEQANISAVLGKMLVTDKKYEEGLFEYARAAQYNGPGELPPAIKQQLLDYFNRAYQELHGSDEGRQQILDQVKTSAVPPQL